VTKLLEKAVAREAAADYKAGRTGSF